VYAFHAPGRRVGFLADITSPEVTYLVVNLPHVAPCLNKGVDLRDFWQVTASGRNLSHAYIVQNCPAKQAYDDVNVTAVAHCLLLRVV
jgi:hypothetical protein